MLQALALAYGCGERPAYSVQPRARCTKYSVQYGGTIPKVLGAKREDVEHGCLHVLHTLAHTSYAVRSRSLAYIRLCSSQYVKPACTRYCEQPNLWLPTPRVLFYAALYNLL